MIIKEYIISMFPNKDFMKVERILNIINYIKYWKNYPQYKKRELEKINDAKETKNKALEVNDWDTCKIAKNQIDSLRDKVRAIDVGYLGFKKEVETGVVDVGTEPIEEEKDWR